MDITKTEILLGPLKEIMPLLILIGLGLVLWITGILGRIIGYFSRNKKSTD
jgi:hypothetical protein